MKVYIPTEYFKHASYIPKDGPKSRFSQSTTKSVITGADDHHSHIAKDRFNEELQYGKTTNKKDEALSAYSRGPQSTINAAKSQVGDRFET